MTLFDQVMAFTMDVFADQRSLALGDVLLLLEAEVADAESGIPACRCGHQPGEGYRRAKGGCQCREEFG